MVQKKHKKRDITQCTIKENTNESHRTDWKSSRDCKFVVNLFRILFFLVLSDHIIQVLIFHKIVFVDLNNKLVHL